MGRQHWTDSRSQESLNYLRVRGRIIQRAKTKLVQRYKKEFDALVAEEWAYYNKKGP